jgi:hypothetical protein
VPSYPAGMTVSNRSLIMLADALRQRWTMLRTMWRRLEPGRQALLVVAHLRKGETYADLARGFAVGTTTVYRYLREGLDVLAAMAPTLDQAIAVAAGKAFVTLDGTLLRIDRVGMASGHDRAYYSPDFWQQLWWAVLMDVPLGLEKIQCPVILAQGTTDVMSTPQTLRYLTMVPGSRLQPLLGAGHAPQSDAPGRSSDWYARRPRQPHRQAMSPGEPSRPYTARRTRDSTSTSRNTDQPWPGIHHAVRAASAASPVGRRPAPARSVVCDARITAPARPATGVSRAPRVTRPAAPPPRRCGCRPGRAS